MKKGRGFSDQGEDNRGGEYESLGGSGVGPAKSIEGWVLFVTGIHEEAQEEDVHDAFADFGDVKNIHLNLDRRTGFVKGYALVEYSNRKEAETAKEAMDGREILTQKVHVDWAFQNGPLNKAR